MVTAAVVVLANLAIRGLWIAAYHARPVSDFAVYYGSAVRWAESGMYTLDGERPSIAWPPGWPLLLRVLYEFTGPSLTAGFALQAVLSSLTAGLVVVLGYQCCRSVRIAAAAGAFFTLLPAGWARDSTLGTEPLFTLLLTLSLLLLVSRGNASNAALAGLSWGASSLVRGTTMFLFPLVGLTELARGNGWRRALRQVAIAGLALVVVLLPWTIRNHHVSGGFVPVSSNLGQNLWQGTRADVGYWWSDDPKENPVLLADSELENDRIGRAAAFEYWREHPGEFVLRAPVKVSGMYEGNAEAFYWLHRTAEMTGAVADRWTALADLAYWCVMGLALAGTVAVLRRGWPRLGWPGRGRPGQRGRPSTHYRVVAVALLGTIAYTTAVFTWFLTWDRFRAPLMPAFCVLAAFGLATVWRAARPSET